MSEERRKFSHYELLILVLILFGTFLTSYYNFLLFHSLAELISISIAIGIFILFWNSRKFLDNTFFLIVGVSFLFTGMMDLIHTLSYKGMDIFIGFDANLPTSLWIAARYMQAMSFLFGAIFINKKLNYNSILIAYLISTIVIFLVIFTGLYPICYVEGQGLTPFKIISEYIIDGILASSIIILIYYRKIFDIRVFVLIIGSIITTIIAELAFTFYIGVYDFSNLLGHLMKITSSYVIYLGLIQIGVQEPVEVLFRKLKQHERELNITNKDLEFEISQKNIAEMNLRQFISTVSHELRTPITVLVQSTETLKNKKNMLNKEQTDKLNTLISKNSILLMQLLENLLVLSSIDEKKVNLKWRKHALKELLQELIYQMQPKFEEKIIEIKLDCDETISIYGDKLKLTQIFRIFLDNAIKYSKNNSEITIKVIDMYQGVLNKGSIDGSVIQFIDNGIGIHPDELPRIFDRFFRSSRVYEISGTGLGLTIAKELIELHKGKINVESIVNKGSTFSLFFPRLEENPLK